MPVAVFDLGRCARCHHVGAAAALGSGHKHEASPWAPRGAHARGAVHARVSGRSRRHSPARPALPVASSSAKCRPLFMRRITIDGCSRAESRKGRASSLGHCSCASAFGAGRGPPEHSLTHPCARRPPSIPQSFAGALVLGQLARKYYYCLRFYPRDNDGRPVNFYCFSTITCDGDAWMEGSKCTGRPCRPGQTYIGPVSLLPCQTVRRQSTILAPRD